MATKRDIEIASLLFRNGIATQEELQSALGHQGKLLTQGTVKTLVEILVERGQLPPDSAHTFSDEPLENTQPLENYEIHALRGEGASARVYEATYKPRALKVALKVLHPEQELQAKTRRRFMREAHLLCKLRHPQIVRGYEVRKVNGYRYLAMQWVEGYELLEIIDKRGRLDDTTALHATRQIASALSYLYSKGIVHRDIKPGNVLADNDWNMWLIDLGLCRLVNDESDEAAGTTVGTVGYISPEQAKGVADLDIRTDIYSLGVSLYHMVTGDVPFSGDDDFEVMSKQIMQSLGSDRIKSLNISPHVHYAIEKMMAKDREIRYQHPDEIVRELDAYLASVGYKPIPTAGAADEEEEQKKSGKIEIVSRRRRGSSSGTRKSYTRRRRRR